MLVTTTNSVYSVVGKGDKIHITKVAAIHPSDYYKVGQTVITPDVRICIGERMSFHDGVKRVSTSHVQYIEE